MVAAQRVGVLALQGAFHKHLEMLDSLGAEGVAVRTPGDLASCDSLIIPGGESTVIFKQLHFIAMVEPLIEFAKSHPVFGTCAGLILMARTVIEDPRVAPLQLIDITVQRNAFGRQAESFATNLEFHPETGRKSTIPALFIRAPRIQAVGNNVQVLASLNGEAVLVQQGFHLAASFHPELTDNTTLHHYFLKLSGLRGGAP